MPFLDWLFGSESDDRKRLFVSFAIEDAKYRDFLIAQARTERSPFDFIDMSVKKPWKNKEWQKRCRTKIRRCHGVIVLLSSNTYHSRGARWEIKCAKEERIPILGIRIKKSENSAIPPELPRTKVCNWTWNNIENFINKL